MLSYTGCQPDGFQVNVKADVLKGLAEGGRSKLYIDWVNGLQSLHLIGFTCAETSGLLLLARQFDRPRQYTCWQFLPRKDLQKLEKALSHY